MSKNKKEKRCLTNNVGNPVNDDANSITVGENGPVILNDFHLIEKLSSFDRERIPERVVHANGVGAKGYFEVTNCMSKYTKAKVFNKVGTKTPVTVRFSTVIGSKGSADTLRDPRGFATKFYTEEGNLDIVGNHIPIFFIRDSKKFPDLIHAFKPSPKNDYVDKSRLWDFLASNPESTNMITFLYSDIGTVKSYRTIEGFGVNTYVWVNEKGERVFIKYHWKPLLGVKTIDRKEAELLAGVDPDVAKRDLYDAIDNGEEVVFFLKVQIMQECDLDKQDFNPLDATKVWPEDKYPLIDVGKMTLNENPKNFFGEIEQIAFCPANLVPGIEFSNDKLLQGRGFSYKDTQRHRIGANFEQLPINMPIVDIDNNTQDGPMRYNYSGNPITYKNNTLDKNMPKECNEGKNSKYCECGKVEGKLIENANDFKQAGERFNSMSDKEKETLIDNIVCDIWEVDKEVQLKVIENFKKADKNWARRVKKRLNL